jgi:hypothetical protein
VRLTFAAIPLLTAQAIPTNENAGANERLRPKDSVVVDVFREFAEVHVGSGEIVSMLRNLRRNR